jgi:hypothetical protein
MKRWRTFRNRVLIILGGLVAIYILWQAKEALWDGRLHYMSVREQRIYGNNALFLGLYKLTAGISLLFLAYVAWGKEGEEKAKERRHQELLEIAAEFEAAKAEIRQQQRAEALAWAAEAERAETDRSEAEAETVSLRPHSSDT